MKPFFSFVFHDGVSDCVCIVHIIHVHGGSHIHACLIMCDVSYGRVVLAVGLVRARMA